VFWASPSLVSRTYSLTLFWNNLCLLLASFFYEVLHVGHVESHLQIVGRSLLWNVGRHEGTCSAGTAILKDKFLPQILRLNRPVIMGILSSVRRVDLLLFISESAVDFHTIWTPWFRAFPYSYFHRDISGAAEWKLI